MKGVYLCVREKEREREIELSDVLEEKVHDIACDRNAWP